jgi:class 3 adenylate cyclase
MQCPNCQFENPTGINYCGECGAKLENRCPGCHSSNPLSFKFCGECGHSLIPAKEISEQKSEAENLSSRPSSIKTTRNVTPLEGERKHVTVLFSDLTGYTAMFEKLDPEDVKEIMSRIFGEAAQIVTKYEGFIEKFIGDVDMEKGTHGVVGDTINMASRLADLAKPGEIIISLETRQLSALNGAE